MRRTIAASVISLCVAALAAGGASTAPCGPTTCAPTSIATPGSGVLLVRPQGAQGPVNGFDLDTGRPTAFLPEGVVSADGMRLVSTAGRAAGSGVRWFDTTTGRRVGTWTLGRCCLAVAAVSANGRLAALTARVDGRLSHDVLVVDLARHAVLRTVRLQGEWKVDALSADGRRLYFLEYRHDGSYLVRVAVAGRGVVPGAITDQNKPEPMTGTPWSSTGTRDGRWQLTLFLKSRGDTTEAFVHALSLDRAAAACIDLSSGGFTTMGRYALVLAPNGRTLYAANPSAGVVSVVDLVRRAVTATVHFTPVAADERTSAAFGAVSRDGRTVYFSAGRGLFGYDTRTGAVRRPYRPWTIMGAGVAPSGAAVLVVLADGKTLRLDARTGAPLRA